MDLQKVFCWLKQLKKTAPNSESGSEFSKQLRIQKTDQNLENGFEFKKQLRILKGELE
ncbi:MAG: hypothetical protein IKF90_03735 [Parasporobacterium sp.]|nr:hypothetical protein [Parasporobacterium sp.]